MLDHVSLGVVDFEKSCAFYDRALAPLGYRRVMNVPQAAGYGPSELEPRFWIGPPGGRRKTLTGPGTHVAFVAAGRRAVDEFYAAAIAAGGRDNGKPGLRTDYHPTYYAAFVLDPDGHHIEAVCHRPE